MKKTIIGIITETTCEYIPTQIVCEITLNEKAQTVSVKRLNTGDKGKLFYGANLIEKYDIENTKYKELLAEGDKT